MKYHRDDEALKAAIETHSVDGMEVVVPIFGEATIIEQGGTGPVKHISPDSVRLGSPMVYFKVRAKHPVPFKRWAEHKFTKPNDRMDMREWLEAVGVRGDRNPSDVYLPMPDYLRKKLEEGDTLSRADVEHDDLVNRGCIDPEGNVSCYTFWQNQVDIDPKQLRVGELVEYEGLEGKERRTYTGSIAALSRDKKIAYLELFTPLSYLELPDSLWSEGIEESFYSPYTYQLGYGTYEAFEIAEGESGEKLIPYGVWNSNDPKERRLYTLKEFMPISVVEDLCKAAYGNEPHCLWQSLIVYVVPIRLDDRSYRGSWHPLPEKFVQVDAVISYEDEDEG